MSGVTEKRKESEEQMNVDDEEERTSKGRKLKVIAGEDRLMGFEHFHRAN